MKNIFIWFLWDYNGNGGIVKNFNVVKIDSKGRMIVPFQLRDYLRLKEGTQMIITHNENKELRIIPLHESTIHVEIIFNDQSGSLVKLIEVLTKNNAEILLSSSKTIERGRLAEWNAIADISSSDAGKIEKDLLALKTVKRVNINTKL